MSVTLRLTKTGKKNALSFRLVASTSRSKRDGKVLDTIGFYNPSNNPELFEYDREKYEIWVKKGALVSNAVKSLIEGSYKYKKYDPKKKEAE